MATRLGARALHMGDITGSLEPGKRADLILVDLSSLHNSPRFRHDPNGTYAQIIYAGKASDVTDVMIEGKWVMRDKQLLTINETDLVRESQEYAQRIDIFLIQREQSILSKLIAIGSATQEESYEVQAKVPLKDPAHILEALRQPDIEIIRTRHYRQYDTYFVFEDPEQGRLRYREDDFVDETGQVTNVRSRLTLVGQASEYNFPQKVLLSRSRFIAPATQTLRFYREYFKPSRELEIEKDRLRFLVRFKGIEFYINVDTLSKPDLGYFLEVKSRTWSRKDAEQKSSLAIDLINHLKASPEDNISEEYVDIVETM
jgi:5-methylthioadenosine/S-adenosylhomocysteine deaminase